jgi:hypothetical protein
MPYINNDGDTRVNNFPVEPKMYVVESNGNNSSGNYVAIGITGFVIVGGMMLVAMSVS